MARVSTWLKVEGNKAAGYEHQAGMWLSKGNEAEERGDHDKAEKCFAKSQYWLDRYNKAAGNL